MDTDSIGLVVLMLVLGGPFVATNSGRLGRAPS
jgi:hypothetical protein